METSYYLVTKKNLFHKKKGAFSCDLRHLQMEEFAFRLMMARVDMEYQAEPKHELKCMQKSHTRQKKKHPDINEL